MTEILTESFCERCGTRYTFESAAPRKSRVGRVRVVSRGLRNFVMQDESTFSEAMADARSDEERAATAHQLDAFHKTFSFCLTCRQYTCANCWNTAEGRCLTCSPIPGMELPDAADAEVEALAAAAAEAEDEAEALAGPEAWPEADLGADRLARALGIAAVAPDGADEGVDASAGVDTVVGAAVAAQVRGVAPGQSLEDALAEYEASVAGEEAAETGAAAVAGIQHLGADEATTGAVPAVTPPTAGADEPGPAPLETEPAPGVEPVAALAAAAAVGAALENEPEPVAAGPEPEPEPVAAGPEPEPAAAEDVVPQPTWPVAATPAVPAAPQSPVAPAATPSPQPAANPWLTVAPDEPAGAPQWPAAPQWGHLQPRRDVPTTLAGRPLLPQDDAAALWAASAQEVLGAGPRPVAPVAAAPATPQPCVSCGLSLSANARFCRRCGTRQG